MWWLEIQEAKAEASVPFMTLGFRDHTRFSAWWLHRSHAARQREHIQGQRDKEAEDPAGRRSVFGDWVITASWNIRAGGS